MLLLFRYAELNVIGIIAHIADTRQHKVVEISIDANKHTGHIVLKPNQSANWQTVLLLVSAVSVVIFIIALYMASIGAWVVLPFSGAEILVIVLVNYHFLSRNARQEVIDFSEDTVTIERGINKPSQTVSMQRHWTKIKTIAPSHPWYPKKIALCSQNELVIVGNFLNEEDRELLIDFLKDILRNRC